MTSKTKKVRSLVVGLEIVVLIFLSVIVYLKYKNRKNILGTTAVVLLNKKDYPVTMSGELKYFYEPEANKTIPEQQLSWLPEKVIYTINQDTLNERYNYPVQKSKNVFRIITLGDSHTFGSYVNTKDNWAEILEDKLNGLVCNSIDKFEVINLGVGGYGPEYIKERYKVRGEKYAADLIIWNESGQGFDRVNELLTPLINEAKSNMTPEEINDSLELGIYKEWQEAFKKLNMTHSYEDRITMVEKSWSDFYRLRDDKKVLVTSHVYLTPVQKLWLENWAAENKNVEFYLKLPDTFAEGLHHLDGHPNKEGHKAVAESTFYYLKNNSFKDCYLGK